MLIVTACMIADGISLRIFPRHGIPDTEEAVEVEDQIGFLLQSYVLQVLFDANAKFYLSFIYRWCLRPVMSGV